MSSDLPTRSDFRRLEIIECARKVTEQGRANETATDETVEAILSTTRIRDPARRATYHCCPQCRQPVFLAIDSPWPDIHCSTCGTQIRIDRPADADGREPIRGTIGRYELLERIGSGGFGTVWRARDPELDRMVAVKIPRADRLSEADAERFTREAQMAARLRHPAIVGVHDVGRDHGIVFIVNDLVDGVTLAQWIPRARPTFRESVDLCRKMALALNYAHRQGIIHRDLTPQNIMIDADGEPKVMDFGLGKLDIGDETVTLDGQVIGTPAYMSPEQARGDSRATDVRTDVYSLGILLYQLVVGQLPFGGSVSQVLVKVLHRDPPSPREVNTEVPRDLETICLKCLEKNPVHRYASCDEVADELARFVDARPIRARPVGIIGRTIRWGQRNPLIAVLVATVLIVATVGGSLTSYFALQSRDAHARVELAAVDVERTAEELSLAWERTDSERRRSERLAKLEIAARRSAERRLGHSRLGIYDAALARVAEKWQSHPQQSLELLWDPVQCPADCRDFAWHLYFDLCREAGAKRAAGVLSDILRRNNIVSNRSRPDMAIAKLSDGQNGLWTVAISPDGKWLAVGGQGGELLLWDFQKKEVAARLAGHTDSVAGLDFSSDGTQLASCSRDRTVRLWDLATRTSRVLRGHQAIASDVVFSPDGQLLASSDFDGIVRFWDAKTGKEMWQSSHGGGIARIAFSPDGAVLAVAYSKAIRLTNVATRSTIGELDAAGAHYLCVAFSPDGLSLASSDKTGRITLWDYETLQTRTVIPSHNRLVRYIAFSPDAKTLASGADDGTVRLWDAETGLCRGTLTGHNNEPAWITGLAFAPDGTKLASCSVDKTVRIWGVRDNQPHPVRFLIGHEGFVADVAFSPDDDSVVSVGDDGMIRVSDPRNGNPLEVHDMGVDKTATIAFDRTDASVLTGATDRWVRRWSSATLGSDVPLYLQESCIRHIVISKDGALVGSVDWSGNAVLWDVAAESLIRRFKSSPSRITTLAFAPNGIQLAIGEADGSVTLWNTNTIEKTATLPRKDGSDGTNARNGPKGELVALAYSPSGDTLAAGYAWHGTNLRLWDCPTGTVRRAVTAHTGFVRDLAFSSDGKQLISAGFDGTVRIWDSERLLLLERLEGSGKVSTIGVSSDNRHIAVGHKDGSLVMWNVPGVLRDTGQ